MYRYSGLPALLLGLLLISCDKDEDATSCPSGDGPSSPTIDRYSLLVDGNYWVYERALLDSTGAYTADPVQVDTLLVSGDTLVDGVVWKKLTSGPGGFYGGVRLRRDSANFLLEQDRGRIFMAVEGQAIVQEEEYPGMVAIAYTVYGPLVDINTSLGTFACKEVVGVTSSLGYPVPPDHRLPRYFWSADQGLVKARVFFLTAGNGYEYRLVDRYVQ